MLGALAMCLVREALFLQGGWLCGWSEWFYSIQEREAGKIPSGSYCVSAKKENENKILTPVQRGQRNSPLVPERDGKGRKEGSLYPCC